MPLEIAAHFAGRYRDIPHDPSATARCPSVRDGEFRYTWHPAHSGLPKAGVSSLLDAIPLARIVLR